MTKEPKPPADQAAQVHSGSRIVSEFVQDMAVDQNLDRDTVEAIATLHRAEKLTVGSLLKALENARGLAKYGPTTKA